MEKAELEKFKMRIRLSLFEKLVLKTAFAEPVLNHHLSGQQSRDALKEWLDTNSTVADSAYGAHFQGDPAQAALYADETKDLIEHMKRTVDECFQTWKEIYEP